MAPKVLIVDDNAELLGLLARVFENSGYQVIQAQRAKAAMERIKVDHPDVAIVDVLLPDVIGYEVAAQLHREKIPFVLMTGVFKGGKHALDARAKYGSAGYFEKPFETQKLLDAIAAIVPPPPRDLGPPRSEAVEIDMNLDVAPESGPDQKGFSLTGRVRVTESESKITATLDGEDIRFRASIPPVMSPMPRLASPSRPNIAPVKNPASVPPGPATIAATAPVGRPSIAPPGPSSVPPGPKSGPPSRIGQLKDNFPQLISAFYLVQETGELTLQRGQVRKIIFFEKGMPVFAISNLATDRFGRFLVRTGKVDEQEFQAAALVAEKTKRRTGDVLIEMGLITETERMYYVAQQVKAIIYGLFAWEDGNWLLSFKARARTETLKLDSHPARLIMRGVKKLYSPTRLQRLMPDTAVPIPCQDPSYLLSDIQLDDWEAMLLSRADGTRKVTELIDYAQKPAEMVRGLLVGLMALRILELGQ